MPEGTQQDAQADVQQHTQEHGHEHAGADIRAEGLSFSYDGQTQVLSEIDLSFAAGRITAIIGANGSGKSTLLHAVARLLKPQHGGVLLDSEWVHEMSPRAAARRIGILLQDPDAMEDLTVYDVVSQGRYPHRRFLRGLLPEDYEKIDEAIAEVQLGELTERPLSTLSGGQRQRVWIAMLLAQDSEYLLLDEPTTFLDLAHQMETLDIVSRLNREKGKTVVMVLHDINQALSYADHLVVMKHGRIHRTGPPGEIVDSQLIHEAFGVPCRILGHPESNAKLCVPLQRAM
jgi:iron complex transport system ATP-binding protein